jgi:hypothetical protein
VTARSRLLILNSPCNPTGVVYSRLELAAIMEVAVRHNLYVLSDEIYEKLIYDGLSGTCVATLGPGAEARTIIVAGFSKTYSMTGWRLGMLVAPPAIAKAAAEIQGQTASNATAFAQYGALAALRETEKTTAALERMLAAFDRRRRLLHAGLTGIPGVSCVLAQGAFYLFPAISSFGLGSSRVLRAAARGGEGGGRPRPRLRRRGLPAHELRHPVIPFIRGDGTGPDIWAASVRVFDAAVEKAYGGKRGRSQWFEVFAGEESFKNQFNNWLPDDTVEAFREYLVGIKGPLTTPVGGGIRSLNVALRQMLDLYVCLRPVQWFRACRRR